MKKFKPLVPATVRTTGITAFFDGACWPNDSKGHAGAGALIKRDNQIIYSESEYLGNNQTSNNLAEYKGLILILKYLVENKLDATIYGDADLVIKQMNFEWKAGTLTKAELKGQIPIKPRYYLPFYHEAMALRVKLLNTTFEWIPRHMNEEADELSTRCLRERGYREETYNRRRQTETEYLDQRFAAICAGEDLGRPLLK